MKLNCPVNPTKSEEFFHLSALRLAKRSYWPGRLSSSGWQASVISSWATSSSSAVPRSPPIIELPNLSTDLRMDIIAHSLEPLTKKITSRGAPKDVKKRSESLLWVAYGRSRQLRGPFFLRKPAGWPPSTA